MPKELFDHMMTRVTKIPGGCWLSRWSQHRGYSRIAYKGTSISCHRLAYEELVGPIAPGMQIDHLCRVRHCCNPAHLEQVTPTENSKRGWATTPIRNYPDRRQMVCARGHELSDKDITSSGYKECKRCVNERRLLRYHTDPDYRLKVLGWKAAARARKRLEPVA